MATATTLRLHKSRPEKVARLTRETVEAGGAVYWVWRHDKDAKRALEALKGWKAPHGTAPMRLGHGQTVAYFSADGDCGAAFTYWNRQAG